MTEVDKSIKLVFNEFQRSIAEVPLEVYYQTLNADQYSQSGYQFNIKSPGTKALLDCDVWIAYDINLIESAAVNVFKNAFCNHAQDDRFPRGHGRIALRSGFAVQRATQNLNVQINNTTLNVRPCQWIDVLNRLYISNDQAEHEFTTSGGRFEEGNHGHRTKNVRYNTNPGAAVLDTQSLTLSNQLPNNFVNRPLTGGGAALVDVLGAAALGNNNRVNINLCDGWYEPLRSPAPTLELYAMLFRPVPPHYEWYNAGFDDRVSKLALLARQVAATNAVANAQFGAIGGNQIYPVTLYERLPIPLFKMYSNDEIYGVIPNIRQMQIQGNFVSLFAKNLLRTNNDAENFMDVSWNAITGANCRIYLRWYTPPMSMSIPREIQLPFKKIVTWSKGYGFAPAGGNANGAYAAVLNRTETQINEYNISLEAIPDLLLIYTKYSQTVMSSDTPDDYNFEITNLMINIDNASGKVNQIQSLDLYNKWKKLLKHADNKIIGYDEWRKYCCVACLQPEDYGVRYGPGYSNPCVLGLRFDPVNWWFNPSIGADAQGGAEYIGGAGGVFGAGAVTAELVVTTIYYKNMLVIRDDGTAKQDLMKMAADFDMVKPDVGMGGMGAAGYGVMNA